MMEYSEVVDRTKEYQRQGIDVVVLGHKEHRSVCECIIEQMDDQLIATVDEPSKATSSSVFQFMGIIFTKAQEE